MPKNSLFPIAYDEISLVDAGGGEAEDGSIGPAVLIFKRDNSSVSKKGRESVDPDRKAKRDDKKKRKRKPESEPCGDTTNSTGAKDGKSKRSKNFKEERHPRDEKGRMKKTSQESKSKYGKGGTTKAKQDAECRAKKGKVKKSLVPINGSAMSRYEIDARLRAVMERKSHGR